MKEPIRKMLDAYYAAGLLAADTFPYGEDMIAGMERVAELAIVHMEGYITGPEQMTLSEQVPDLEIK